MRSEKTVLVIQSREQVATLLLGIIPTALTVQALLATLFANVQTLAGRGQCVRLHKVLPLFSHVNGHLYVVAQVVRTPLGELFLQAVDYNTIYQTDMTHKKRLPHD